MLRQGPIPHGILTEVTKIIEDKWKSGVYKPSSSSYNSCWFCVFKKDGKSLRLVHSLEPLNAVTIRNSTIPPYTDVVTEDFAGHSVYSTLDLYVSFNQRQLHPNSHDLTTFNTPLGTFHLTVLPMGWTNSPAVLQGNITHILRPEIPHWTQPFVDDVPIKGPRTQYELLSRRWYILLLPQDYLLLPLGRVVAGDGGVEKRSEVMYCIEGRTYIYYKEA